MENQCPKINASQCQNLMLPIQDSLELLSGKWKIPIIVALIYDVKRFSDLSREIPRITDRMLSKELRDLEANMLVKRTVYDTFPVTVEYTMTDYGRTLRPVIEALADWGRKHRDLIMQD
jgi:DNA-binding HxlR family transcriptional regulator